MSKQREPSKAPAAAAILVAGVIAAAAALIAPWEGQALKPYKDIVGVWTVCYGSTNAEMRQYTPSECAAILETETGQYLQGVASCIHQPVTTNQLAALTSWTYNVGVGAACNSTLVALINAKRPAIEWCGQLLRWDYAGGRKVKGLTNRRQAEYKVCVS